MSAAEITQIVIGALSLLATIAVSFLIYWLQTRHEKEIEKRDEQRRKTELENQANVFLSENESERDYLPWCIIATNLHRQKKHTRAIYTNFCRCPVELQKEILKQAELTYDLIDGTDWLDASMKKLREDISKYKLASGDQDFLYDGAKYFHRGFDYYRENLYTRDDPKVIKSLYATRPFFGESDGKIGIRSYIEEYFDFILNMIPKDVLTCDNPIPPIEFIWRNKNLFTANELSVCYWVMFYVFDIIVNIHNRTKGISGDLLYENQTDAEIEFFEDMYYETLLWLYVTYNT